MIAFAHAPSRSLTREPPHPQTQQFLDSHVRVTGREPTADEIRDFEHRHRLTRSAQAED
jgi:hypothetical protein